jgi:hypothetical protein
MLYRADHAIRPLDTIAQRRDILRFALLQVSTPHHPLMGGRCCAPVYGGGRPYPHNLLFVIYYTKNLADS